MRSDAALDEVMALASGRRFAALEGFARVVVSGGDAVAWLHDLLTADVSGLPHNGARRSFLLTPTGRIRADVWVTRRDGGVDLVERADEPDSIASLLAPFVLSSDVVLSRPVPVAVVAFPAPDASDRVGGVLRSIGVTPSSPSVLGPGLDAIVDAAMVDPIAGALGPAATPTDEAVAEALRIHRGIPRWRVDVDPEGFPVATRTDDAVASAKGCFLGQEAVAKVRNLGHPPTALLHLETPGATPAGGTPVVAGGQPVGRITSATPTNGGAVVLARVRWAARNGDLALPDGSPLRPARAAGPSPRTG